MLKRSHRAARIKAAVQGTMPRETGFEQDLCADIDGVSLHAAVRCGADDRKALEHIIDATTRETVHNPIALAIRDNTTVGLTPNCVLIRRDGAEAAIEDSAAPIHDCRGE